MVGLGPGILHTHAAGRQVTAGQLKAASWSISVPSYIDCHRKLRSWTFRY